MAPFSCSTERKRTEVTSDLSQELLHLAHLPLVPALRRAREIRRSVHASDAVALG